MCKNRAMKNSIFLACVFVLLVGMSAGAEEITFTVQTYSQEENEGDSKVSIENNARKKALGIARSVVEVAEMNIFLTSFNKFVREADYSDINLGTMKNNLTSAWVWDQDEFNINQIGHPYQGSFYFVAGRANGLDYWQSLLLAAFGSLTWEYFMENETPSYNDLIATSISASLFGEVLHRLYLLSADFCAPLSWVVSPQDAFNRFITGAKAPEEDGHLTELSFSALGAWELSKNAASGGADLSDAQRWGGGLAVSLVYEDPYTHDTCSVFDQYTLKAQGIFSASYYYLFLSGIAPFFSRTLDTKYDKAVAVSLHYDVIYSPEINYNNNALGLSFYSRRPLGNWTAQYSVHANGTFLGSSENYYLLSQNKRNAADDHSEQRLYDLGVGANAKAGASLSHATVGTFFIEASASVFWTIPSSVQHEGSKGSNMVFYTTCRYEHSLYKGWWAGATCFLYAKQALYESMEDTSHILTRCGVYVKYSLF